MANSNSPTTPVKVPGSAANYTSATLDPDLRSQINTLLIKDGHIDRIYEQFTHNLNANSANWPTLVQNHALALLRSGEVTTFPALFKRIMEDIRHDTALGGGSSKLTNGTVEVNGSGSKNGVTSSSENGTTAKEGSISGSGPNGDSLAVPQAVVDDAVKMTKEALETFCEIDPNGTT